MKNITFFLLLIFALSACKSADKLYQEGNYNKLISKLEGKAKKGNLDRKEKSMLIKSANKYASSINSEVLASLGSTKPSDWTKSKKKLLKLDERLNEIKSYSQISNSEINESRSEEFFPKLNKKLYDYTINIYDEAIANYDKTGNRDYAIKAHAHAIKLYDYDGDPKTVESLELLALDLGHRTIYVDVDGPIGSNFIFDRHFEDRLDLNNDLFNSFVEFGYTGDLDYKLSIDVDITRKDNKVSTNEKRYKERVVDYYDKVLDTATNKYNEIPVYKDIEAVVETSEILKFVEGEYEYEIRDLRTNRRFDGGGERHRVESSEVVHELESGDEEAVPSGIDLRTVNIFDRRDYDDLIEELFEELAKDFNNVRIKNKLL